MPNEFQQQKPLVVIGGGFAGTTTLLHTLLKICSDDSVTADSPVPITVVERYPQQMHGGIGYGQTPHFEYMLNLSAKRVTPFPAGKMPEGYPSFEDYILERAEQYPDARNNLANPSRQLYGLYLNELIDIAVGKAGGKVKFERKYDEAIDVTEHASGVKIDFKSGDVMQAGHVILATGYKEAVMPKYMFNAMSSPNFLDYPYSEKANRFYDRLFAGPDNREDAHALVIGTGLSSMDAAIRLLDSGYKGKITMLSRKGMFHTTYREFLNQDFVKAGLQGEPRPLETLPFARQPPDFMEALATVPDFKSFFKHVSAEFEQRVREGNSTEEVLSHWERFVPQIFERFPEDTAKFLRVNETLINLMRVGTTPMITDKIFNAIEAGRIEVVRGTIQDMMPGQGKFSVAYVDNDKNGVPLNDKKKYKTFDTIISGIGNSTKFDLPPERIGTPLWRNLCIKQGYQPHPVRDGINVTDDFSMIRGDGTVYSRISAIGSHVAGHMNVSRHTYPEKPGLSGGRLGAFTINIQGILGGVVDLVDAKYGLFKRQMQPSPAASERHVACEARPA